MYKSLLTRLGIDEVTFRRHTAVDGSNRTGRLASYNSAEASDHNAEYFSPNQAGF